MLEGLKDFYKVVDTMGLEIRGSLSSSWALFSPDQRYRYALGRHWHWNLPNFVWIMLNPSIAGVWDDDPTIRKVIGFTARNGGGGFLVINLAALIDKDPKRMAKDPDPIGPHNPAIVKAIHGLPNISQVLAWGSDARTFAPLLQPTLELIRFSECLCLGQTKAGEPRHPGRIGYDTPLIPFVKPTSFSV